MARIRALVAHILGRICRDAACGPCSFRRAADHDRDKAVEQLRWAVQIALHRAAGGKPIRRPLGRLTVNRVADLAHKRGYELRLSLQPREDDPR